MRSALKGIVITPDRRQLRFVLLGHVGSKTCYQNCYHFAQKPAKTSVNQAITRWIMSLKYKEQHERRRNLNQTHNPKVGGSNPPPATIRTRISALSWFPIPSAYPPIKFHSPDAT